MFFRPAGRLPEESEMWEQVFGLQMSWVELVLRGTAMYWFLFLLFRFVLRRDVGQIGIADVLLLVVVADAAQNGMAGEYRTVTEGMILVGTIAGWNWLLDWLAFRYKAVARFTEPPVRLLVRHGRMILANMRRELLTPDELVGQLRAQGISSLREVRHAYLESDGRVSVIRFVAPPKAPRARE
jgi:uncharacterized membrane protein YcaP (DUF421 family)